MGTAHWFPFVILFVVFVALPAAWIALWGFFRWIERLTR